MDRARFSIFAVVYFTAILATRVVGQGEQNFAWNFKPTKYVLYVFEKFVVTKIKIN